MLKDLTSIYISLTMKNTKVVLVVGLLFVLACSLGLKHDQEASHASLQDGHQKEKHEQSP